jgi:hypothetical protein
MAVFIGHEQEYGRIPAGTRAEAASETLLGFRHHFFLDQKRTYLGDLALALVGTMESAAQNDSLKKGCRRRGRSARRQRGRKGVAWED